MAAIRKPSNGKAVKARKPPRKMTQSRLRNIALFYLERFSTTAANLKRVLMRRADRALRAHKDAKHPDRREIAAWIEELVADLVAKGAVDDTRYARGRVTTLRGLGQAASKIRSKLAAKGTARPAIDIALKETAHTADGEDADLRAARDYARRRRLGPHRTGPQDADTRRKDLAALGRAGFSYAIARKAMVEDNE